MVASACWVRAMIEPCFRLLQQQPQRFWPHDGRRLYAGWKGHRNLDVVLGTGCALHDIATALRWATALILNQEEYKAVYLLVEGLRNGSRYLHKVLPKFVTSCVVFDDGDDCSDEQIALFWQAIGIPDEIMGEFVQLYPRWFGDALHVRCPLEQRSGVFDRLEAVVAFPCRFRKMISPRWLALGSGARLLLQARPFGP